MKPCGEQSFIDLILRGEIGEGKFFGTTPCFRDDVVDEIHGKYFLKVELATIFKRPHQGWATTRLMVNSANNFFKSLSGWASCDFDITNDVTEKCQIDLKSPKLGIELGSYGLRRVGEWDLYYGTGLAEPRFSYTLKKECLTSRTETLGSKL